MKNVTIRLISVLALFALSGCLGQESFKSNTSGSSDPGLIPSEDEAVIVKVNVSGAGLINVLDQTTVCDESAECEIMVIKDAEIEFQADWDISDGLELVSFTGCDLKYASDTICRITATAARTISVVFSKRPWAEFLASDQGAIVYVSLFDGNQDALTYDSDGSIASLTIVSSSGDPVICALGGDPASPAPNSSCLTDPDYLFVVEVDPSLVSLTVTLSVVDDKGLTAEWIEPLR